MSISCLMQNLRTDERGATAVEYGLIVVMIVIATIGALQGVADANTGLWAVVKQNVLGASGNH